MITRLPINLGTSHGRKLANWVGFKQEISMADLNWMALFSDKLENDLNWVGFKQEISMADLNWMALFSDKHENDLIVQTLTTNHF